ncbi:hypothetical protein [Haloferax sp. DFSO52]|uniref:hypothetical protein n=1 Tax=Haloferax sp. DFSO52 TaxID=3388505 RepID=UPI003A8AE6E8
MLSRATEMELPSRTLKRASIALLVALLMTTAGCSSFTGGDTSTPTEAVTTETTAQTTQTTETTTQTTTQQETTTEEDSNSSGNNSTSNETGASSIDAAYTGEMAVMVAGDRIDIAEKLDEEDAVAVTDTDTWYTNESTTLAEALADTGVEASESTLSYDGETYDESTDGTKIIYRVDSHEVDPDEYTLESDDQIWVMVITDDSNVTTPGEYIPPEQLHVHGTIDFTVDGEQLDFSRDKYQQAGHNDHFHFEGGHANPWHAHSAHVTLAYAMSTLDGINMTDDSVTYNGTTYPYDGENGTVTVTVNGDPVEPTEYYLKDGDSVSIEIESSN